MSGTFLYPPPPCTLLLFKFGPDLRFCSTPFFLFGLIGLDSEHLFKLITIIDWMDIIILKS